MDAGDAVAGLDHDADVDGGHRGAEVLDLLLEDGCYLFGPYCHVTLSAAISCSRSTASATLLPRVGSAAAPSQAPS